MVQVYLQNYVLRYLNKAMVHNVFSKQCIAAFVRSNGTSVFAKHFLAVFYETAAQMYLQNNAMYLQNTAMYLQNSAM